MDTNAGIVARWSTYLDRYVQVGVVGNQVIAIEFPASIETPSDEAHPVLDAIERYLDGDPTPLSSVQVVLTVDHNTRAVLDTVREIPYGSERDIDTICRMTPELGTDAHELAAQALAANPIPLVIPDHRVTDGPSSTPASVRQRLRALEGL